MKKLFHNLKIEPMFIEPIHVYQTKEIILPKKNKPVQGLAQVVKIKFLL